MIQKIKVLIKYILYYSINLLVRPTKIITKNSLLLIRLDAIGDYILFRNYIEILKKSEKYKDYTITLLGNNVWKSLSEELDSDYVDKFLWLDRNKFSKDFAYRYKKFQEITSVGYEIVLSPVYSREFFIVDNIVKLLHSKLKIGSIGDVSNIKKWQKNISDKYYDELIKADENIMFEFTRNKDFFENLLDVKLDIIKPIIKLKDKKLDFNLSNYYAILFIGASASFRKWDIKKFAEIASYLKNNYCCQIVLCGAPSDKIDALEFAKYFQDDYVDLVGKTSLLELLYIIYKGNLMIANETSAPHFAIALEMTNLFVISNGNHYGRFTPYPKEVSENYHVIYHPKIEKDLQDCKKLSNIYGYGSNLDINDISVKSVIVKLSNYLKKNEKLC